MGRKVRVGLVWSAALLFTLQFSQVLATKPVEAGYEAATPPQSVQWCSGRPGDSRSYCWRNCTSYVAYKLSKSGVPKQYFAKLGHAKQWAEAASKRGIRKGTVPRVGAVAYWNGGEFGHVAWVEAVHADGSVLASSYNGFTESYSVQDRVRPEGYIYFGNVSAKAPQNITLTQALGRAVYKTNVLSKGKSLRPNQYLGPKDTRYGLVLQGDGNLVLYNRRFRPLWRSQTEGSGADRLIVQPDGNLVLYDGARAVWSSRTDGQRATMLAAQGDGNVVLYDKNWLALWATHTENL